MQLRRDVPLAPYTTFELGGPARAFVEVTSEAELHEALELARRASMPVFVLGGGSNLVVADRGFDGLVVRIGLRGVELADERASVAAGEPWDPFVARMVAADLAGVEALSGIPGSVGATPIQNVGAYGQEVSETIVSVRTVDAKTGEVRVRAPESCAFGYRTSIFKDEARDEIVTRVDFALRRGGTPHVRYAELEKALGSEPPTLAKLRETVVALRRSKSMVIAEDDPNRRSAGSFFTNPIVAPETADEVGRRALALGISTPMPRFDGGGGRVKLSAGWLIERAGIAKGTRRGPVGVSTKHALALVHLGGGRASDLVALAREVRDAVQRTFGVVLRPEPVLLGFAEDELP